MAGYRLESQVRAAGMYRGTDSDFNAIIGKDEGGVSSGEFDGGL